MLILQIVNAFVSYSGTRKSFDHLISDSKAPKRPEMESGMTTPPKMRRVAENDYEIGESAILAFTSTFDMIHIYCNAPMLITETQRIGNSHLRKVSVSESNVLLDEEVLTDPKIQALLLTVLVRRPTSSNQKDMTYSKQMLYLLVPGSAV